MTIGELARKTGITLRTIRYYEELGLIKPLTRSKGGFRLFSENDVSRIKLIHFLKSMDLPLNTIKALLLSKKHGVTMGEVVAKLLPQLESFVEEAQRKIEKYQKMKNDIEKTKTILQECADCDRIPDEVSCINCEVIKSEEEYPLVVRLIF